MNATEKGKKVKGYNVERELAKVDRILKSIECDKSLPTFCNFFLECLILGTANNVNLEAMYPTVFKKLDTLLAEHKSRIEEMRK